jgi:hypothetical protein
MPRVPSCDRPRGHPGRLTRPGVRALLWLRHRPPLSEARRAAAMTRKEHGNDSRSVRSSQAPAVEGRGALCRELAPDLCQVQDHRAVGRVAMRAVPPALAPGPQEARAGRGRPCGLGLAGGGGFAGAAGLAAFFSCSDGLLEQLDDLRVHRPSILHSLGLDAVSNRFRETDIDVHDLLSHASSLPRRYRIVADMAMVML